MIPEIGHFALILSFCFSIALGVLPMLGVYQKNTLLIWLAGPLVAAQLVFIAISFALLTWSFAVDDFSVIYVASNSNRALPMVYKVTAVWGAHEGPDEADGASRRSMWPCWMMYKIRSPR